MSVLDFPSLLSPCISQRAATLLVKKHHITSWPYEQTSAVNANTLTKEKKKKGPLIRRLPGSTMRSRRQKSGLQTLFQLFTSRLACALMHVDAPLVVKKKKSDLCRLSSNLASKAQTGTDITSYRIIPYLPTCPSKIISVFPSSFAHVRALHCISQMKCPCIVPGCDSIFIRYYPYPSLHTGPRRLTPNKGRSDHLTYMRMLVLFLAANLPAHLALFPSWAGRLLGFTSYRASGSRGAKKRRRRKEPGEMSQSPALQLTMPACTALVWLPGWKTLPVLSAYPLVASRLSVALRSVLQGKGVCLGPCNNPIASLRCPHTTCSERPANLNSDCMHGRSTLLQAVFQGSSSSSDFESRHSPSRRADAVTCNMPHVACWLSRECDGRPAKTHRATRRPINKNPRLRRPSFLPRRLWPAASLLVETSRSPVPNHPHHRPRPPGRWASTSTYRSRSTQRSKTGHKKNSPSKMEPQMGLIFTPYSGRSISGYHSSWGTLEAGIGAPSYF